MGAGALPPPDGAEGRSRSPGRCSRSASRSRSAAAPGTSSRAPTCSSPARPRAALGSLNGTGRNDFWRVAIDSFGEEPVLGTGAGTYQFDWEKHRSIDLPVHDAHSLYLEAFAELGGDRRDPRAGPGRRHPLVGVLRLARRPRRPARALRRRARGPGRDGGRRSASTGSGRSLAMGSIFFISPRVAIAGPLRPAGSGRRPGATGRGRRWALTAATLAVAWIAAVALVRPLLVEHEIDASQNAAAAERPAERRRPRRTGALDRAVRRLALRPARPARPAAGRIRSRDLPFHEGDRPRGRQLAVVLPALQGRARSRREGRRRGRPRKGPGTESPRVPV